MVKGLVNGDELNTESTQSSDDHYPLDSPVVLVEAVEVALADPVHVEIDDKERRRGLGITLAIRLGLLETSMHDG